MEKRICKITIKFQSNPNGTVSMSHSVDGDNFHFFEIVGLIEVMKFDLLKGSIERAAAIEAATPTPPEDKMK